MLDKILLEVLECPKYKGNLYYDEKNNTLICYKCRLKFKIEEGVPNMLLRESERF